MCGEWEWSWARFDPGFSLAGLLQSNEGQTQFGFHMSLVRLTMEENAVRHPLLLTRTQARGKKTHTCNKIKMIKRRGRDIMWRGRKKRIEKWERNEWWMNESSCWGWGRCYQRGEDAPVVNRQSVIQPLICDAWARANVCVRQTRRGSFIKRRAEWQNIEGKNWPETAFLSHEGGKATALCMRESGVHERGETEKKKMGGEKRVCNCRAAVLSGGGCHLESGWLSSGH